MWSRVNRGTPERPGLVLTLLSGGSCKGMAFRLPRVSAREDLHRLWAREMPNQGVYDPKWLHCATPAGPVKALAFTLSRQSPNFTGELTPEQYRDIFAQASGRYGTTLDYARATYDSLLAHGIRDQHLARMLAHAP
jgi:cation transport protein ChaC